MAEYARKLRDRVCGRAPKAEEHVRMLTFYHLLNGFGHSRLPEKYLEAAEALHESGKGFAHAVALLEGALLRDPQYAGAAPEELVEDDKTRHRP